MNFHHTGCLVENIDNSIEQYKKLLGASIELSPVFDIKDQLVKVCFITLKDQVYLELVEPQPTNRRLLKLLHKKKTSFYHLAFTVKSIKKEIERLQNEHFKLIGTFASQAFNGRECAFLYNEELHLIELIEA